MARMYSRNKGKAKSKKPLEIKKPVWLGYKPSEIESIVAKLAKSGKTPSQIGAHLRDAYGVPSVKQLTGKTLSVVLQEKDLLKEMPEDLMALIRRTVMLRNHMEKNKQDQSAKRGLRLTESKIKRLADYYKQTKKISMDWKYDPEKIKLFIE